MFSSGSQLLCLEKQRAVRVSSIQVGCGDSSHIPAESEGHCAERRSSEVSEDLEVS